MNGQSQASAHYYFTEYEVRYTARLHQFTWQIAYRPSRPFEGVVRSQPTQLRMLSWRNDLQQTKLTVLGRAYIHQQTEGPQQ